MAPEGTTKRESLDLKLFKLPTAVSSCDPLNDLKANPGKLIATAEEEPSNMKIVRGKWNLWHIFVFPEAERLPGFRAPV